MTTRERPSDDVIEQTIKKRFRNLLILAAVIVIAFPVLGTGIALVRGRPVWGMVWSGLMLGVATILLISVFLMLLPEWSRRFGLPTYQGGDERENRIQGIAVQWAYQAVSLGCIGYGAWNGNFAVILISILGQVILLTLLVLLNRRM